MIPAAMHIEIRREDGRSLAEYASVPIAFEVRAAVDVTMLRIGAADLTYRSITPPRVKDYDAYSSNGPLCWSSRFAVDSWIILAAYNEQGERVGGLVVISEPAAIAEVGGRLSYAVLWDIRVIPSLRGRGVGGALLTAAEEMMRATGCRGLDAETQDINVAACGFYAARGFTLTAIVPAAYADAPSETKLVWTKSFF